MHASESKGTVALLGPGTTSERVVVGTHHGKLQFLVVHAEMETVLEGLLKGRLKFLFCVRGLGVTIFALIL